jgi:hypothetical protein
LITSEEVLRRLTIADPTYLRALSGADPEDSLRRLDARSVALLELGGLITGGAAGPVWQQCVARARSVGLSLDEVVGSLLALAPTIGFGRVVAAAPHLARALGYDIDSALHGYQGDEERTEWPHP